MRPETFASLLQSRIGDPLDSQYRLRWSPSREAWQIEQQTGRGQFDGLPPESASPDERVRAQDGYSLVMEVAPYAQMRCPECAQKIEGLVFGKWKEVRCSFCWSRNGDNTWHHMAFFPLCDRLLEHLERTSPKRTLIEAQKRDARNQWLAQSERRRHSNNVDAIAREQAADILGVGSSTHVHPW